MSNTDTNHRIPIELTEKQFEEFFCKDCHPLQKKGRKLKLPLWKYFNYIVRVLYTGMQWASLEIEKDADGKPEIHYTSVFKRFRAWNKNGIITNWFEESVCRLQRHDLLDTKTIHGDGTSTAAKKGGDEIGFNGHKRHKGDKIIAFTDRNANIISPFVTAPGNRNETILLEESLHHLSRVTKRAGIELEGSVMSLDAGYDSVSNRKLIFNRGMIPNIKEVKRSRKSPNKRGRKRIYNEEIFQERFRTVERAFAWEDKFKRLLLRFERNSSHHLGLKMLAYTLINLRHFC